MAIAYMSRFFYLARAVLLKASSIVCCVLKCRTSNQILQWYPACLPFCFGTCNAIRVFADPNSYLKRVNETLMIPLTDRMTLKLRSEASVFAGCVESIFDMCVCADGVFVTGCVGDRGGDLRTVVL